MNAEDKTVLLQVTHEVKDYTTWKKGFDTGKADRDKAGIRLIGVYTALDNGNLVTVVTEAPNAEVAKGFASDPNLKAAMEKIGVISAPEIKILKKQQ
jgi:hypothetical protein